MLCLIKIKTESVSFVLGENLVDKFIEGWVMATDVHDLRRQTQGGVPQEVANALYRMEFAPQPGKYEIAHSYLLLVS